MFEGVRGQEFTSDIAIDNVVVSRGECDDKCQEENGFTSCFSEQNTFGILLRRCTDRGLLRAHPAW